MLENKPHEIRVENKALIPLVVFQSTLSKFYELEKTEIHAMHALGLYLFYYKTYTIQDTHSLYATESFVRKGTNLSARKYKGAKRLLREMGLISSTWLDRKTNKPYFLIKIDDNLTLRQDETDKVTKRTRYETSPQNAPPVIINAPPVTIKSSKEDLGFDKPSKIRKNNVCKKSNFAPKIVKKDKNFAPKIKKKKKNKDVDLDSLTTDPYEKNPRLAGYKYTRSDEQLYRSLIELGAKKHSFIKTKQRMPDVYYATMDRIHEILDSTLDNPYKHSKNIPEEYREKKWTQDDIIATFKYYMSIVDPTKMYYRTIADFIFASYNGTKSWSPLVRFHKEMNQDNGSSLEGDAKKFHSELERLHIGKFFDAKAINRMIRLMDVICSGYVPNPRFRHIYYDNIIFAFTEYIEPKLRITTFKPGYIQSEKFIQQFFDEYVSREILIPENGVL